jgi:hypothetical protein
MSRMIFDYWICTKSRNKRLEAAIDFGLFLIWPYWLLWVYAANRFHRNIREFDEVNVLAAIAAVAGLISLLLLWYGHWGWAVVAGVVYILTPALAYLIIAMVSITWHIIRSFRR